MTDTILFNSVSTMPIHQAHRTWGVYRIATEFRKQGLSCRVISFFNSFSFEELDTILQKTIEKNTIIVGFSSNFWDWINSEDLELTVKRINYIIDYINNNYPHVKIIVGGTSSIHYLSKKLKRVDAIFQGYAENSLLKYLKSIKENKHLPLPSTYSIESEINHGNIPTYSDLTTDIFDFNDSQVIYEPEDVVGYYDFPTIEIGRGCIFKCSFCNYLLNGKNKLDYIKYIDNLREEFTRNYEQHGIQNYILGDDTFNDSTEKVVALHSVLTSLPFKVRFACYLRLDLLYAHQEQIPLLKEMGLMGAFFGIETFHKKAGSIVGKSMDSERTIQFLADLKKIHWGNDIKISVGFITGIPYEPLDSYKEVINWIHDENNLVDNVVVEALNVPNPNKIAPGVWTSEFTKNSEKYGFYWPDDISDYHGNWHNSIGPVHNRNQAKEIENDIRSASILAKRANTIIYYVLKVWSVSQFLEVKPTLDELLSLTRHELSDYVHGVIYNSDAEKRYIESYKNKVFESF